MNEQMEIIEVCVGDNPFMSLFICVDFFSFNYMFVSSKKIVFGNIDSDFNYVIKEFVIKNHVMSRTL